MAKKSPYSQAYFEKARKALAQEGVVGPPQKPSGGPLIIAAREGKLKMVRALLDAGASPNARDGKKDRPVLTVAAIAGEAAIVDLLLERGADVGARDADHATAIYHATTLGHTLVVQALWEAGVQCSRPGNAGALSIYARQGGHEELAEWLDALWEKRDLDGATPRAAESGEARRPRL